MQNLFYLNLQDLRPDIYVYEAFATAESCFVILDWKDWTEISIVECTLSTTNSHALTWLSFQSRETSLTAVHSE